MRPFKRVPPDFFSLSDADRNVRWRAMSDVARKITWLRYLLDATYDELEYYVGLRGTTLSAMACGNYAAGAATLARLDGLLALHAPDAAALAEEAVAATET